MGAFERLKALNARLFELEMTQKTLGAKVDIKPHVISMLISGRMIATQDEREKISEAVKMSENELFNG